MSPRLKKWVEHVPRVPHQIAPMNAVRQSLYECATKIAARY